MFVLLLAVGAGAVGGRLSSSTDGEDVAASSAATTQSVEFESEGLDVASVVAEVEASVVSIEATVETQQGPFLAEGESAGTGVVIDDDGDILTNAHVVEGATSVTVTLQGEDSSRTATVVASDEEADIAVLHVDDADGLTPVTVAESGTTAVGDEVVAIGNALALEGGMTVTQGIVSAVDRSVDTESGTLSGLIQTDAAISSGNSGGPLVNAAGEVVGINTAVATSDGTYAASNIGFAISIDTALDVANALLETA